MSPTTTKPVPQELIDFAAQAQVGYITTTSPKGLTYTHPVAFHYNGKHVLFGTPKGSAKMRFIEANPQVTFTLDNGKLTKGACGFMMHGKAKVYDVKSMMTSFLSVAKPTWGFLKKYPNLFTFYTLNMKELPDERKFYKYRFICINPTSMVYWIGYNFNRVKFESGEDPFTIPEDTEEDNETLQELEGIFSSLKSLSKPPPKDPLNLGSCKDLFKELNNVALASGPLNGEEQGLLRSLRNSCYTDISKASQPGGLVTNEERSILKLAKISSDGKTS